MAGLPLPSLSSSQNDVRSLRGISLYSSSLILPPFQKHLLYAKHNASCWETLYHLSTYLCQSSLLDLGKIHRICISVCFQFTDYLLVGQMSKQIRLVFFPSPISITIFFLLFFYFTSLYFTLILFLYLSFSVPIRSYIQSRFAIPWMKIFFTNLLTLRETVHR